VLGHLALVFVHRLVPRVVGLVIIRSVRGHPPAETPGRDADLVATQGDSGDPSDDSGDPSDTTLGGAFFVALLAGTAWLAWWSGAVAWWLATGAGHGGRLIAGTTTLGLWRLDRGRAANP
jgi:hypothetical protein